jgi:hypothetical protein
MDNPIARDYKSMELEINDIKHISNAKSLEPVDLQAKHKGSSTYCILGEASQNAKASPATLKNQNKCILPTRQHPCYKYESQTN